MKINGKAYRTIWPNEGRRSFSVIDQTVLPHRLVVKSNATLEEAAHTIAAMVVRGAPLIGVTAAYGVAVAMNAGSSDSDLAHAIKVLGATRPTAVNLHWTLARAERMLGPVPAGERAAAAWDFADRLAEEDVAINAAIGRYGSALIEELHRQHGRSINVATHCNAGWLATVDWGTALAPVYHAFDRGIDVHVYTDETRPRLQGAALTAFELGQHGVPHTILPDGASGHVMRTAGMDLVIVGCDRVAANGDTANKIGTYMQALAAHDNGVPFYVALPSRTVDLSLAHGGMIEIEHRTPDEVLFTHGTDAKGDLHKVRIAAPGSTALNPAFDVTPARLIRGYITERGILSAYQLQDLVAQDNAGAA